MTDNLNNNKLVFKWIFGVSVFVFIMVLVLNRKIIPRPEHIPEFVYVLPTINALLNGTCTILLLASLYFIRKKNILMHKRINLTTFGLSALFFACYITYHYLADETVFPKDNPNRSLYLSILISHIILAATVLPLVLISFYLGLTNQVQKHKKLVRWTYPIWLYVTVSGVIVYLMISPFYQH